MGILDLFAGEDDWIKEMKEKYIGQEVLLKGGFRGTVLDMYGYDAIHFRVKVDTKIFLVFLDNIVAVEEKPKEGTT